MERAAAQATDPIGGLASLPSPRRASWDTGTRRLMAQKAARERSRKRRKLTEKQKGGQGSAR